MKKIFKNILLLGGFYLILSCLLDYIGNTYLSVLFFIIFVVLIIITVFNKNINVYDKLINKHLYICNYLISLGFVQYISALLFLIVSIDGYNYAKAEYEGAKYESFFLNNEQNINIFYYTIIIISLLFATYESFVKNKPIFSKKA